MTLTVENMGSVREEFRKDMQNLTARSRTNSPKKENPASEARGSLPELSGNDHRSQPMFTTNKVKTEVVDVTPGMARHLRTTCHFERQRNLNEKNIRRLGFEMKHGRFIVGTPIFFCVFPDGTAVIINGNHTLEAIAQSDLTVRLTFISLHVANMEEAAAAYATMDIQRTRSWADAIRAYGKGDGIKYPDKVVSALGIILNGLVSDHHSIAANSRAVRLEAMEDYENVADILFAAVDQTNGDNKKILLRRSVLSIALETTRYQPSASCEFWRGFCLDDGLSRNDPRKALLEFLRKLSMHGHTNTPDALIGCKLAWNAFFRGSDLSTIRVGSTKGVVPLLGTPYGSKASKKPTQIEKDAEPKPDKPSFITGMAAGPHGAIPVTIFQ